MYLMIQNSNPNELLQKFVFDHEVSNEQLLNLIDQVEIVAERSIDDAACHSRSDLVMQRLISKCPAIGDRTLCRLLQMRCSDQTVQAALPKINIVSVGELRTALEKGYLEATVAPLLRHAIQLDPSLDTAECMYWVLYGRVQMAEQMGLVNDRAASGRSGADQSEMGTPIYSDQLIGDFLSQAKQVDRRTAEDILCAGLPLPHIKMAFEKATQGDKLGDPSRASIFVGKLLRLNNVELFKLYLAQGGVIDKPKSYFQRAFALNCHEEILVELCKKIKAGELEGYVNMAAVEQRGYSEPTVQLIREALGASQSFCILS